MIYLMKAIPHTCWLLTLCPLFLWAQPGNLKSDADFFYLQKRYYQTWLDREGIGAHLQVREMEIGDNQLAVYLEFPYQNLDSMVNAYDQLKATAEQGSPLTFEEQLFYKLALMMEVKQTALNIQIYDTYDLRKEPLFFRGIYFDREAGKVLVQTSDPKSQIEEIYIPVRRAGGAGGNQATLDRRFEKGSLFQQIEAFSRNKYEVNYRLNDDCSDRKPQLVLLENEQHLHFRVYDLCLEVLRDETNSIPCQLIDALGFECSDITREFLDFVISYEETLQGVKLTIKLDGKFGSGFYDQVSRGAYHNMELEPRFKSYIEEYADRFKLELKRYLIP